MSVKSPIASLLLLLAAADTLAVEPTDGSGDAAFVPLYTTENGHNSLLTISNLSQEAAIKVVFEDVSGQPQAALNLYLVDQDSWVLSLYEEDGQIIASTPDSSCTAPYLFESQDPQPLASLPAVGRIVVINMGRPGNDVRSDAFVGGDGIPQDCDAIVSRFEAGGQWSSEPNEGFTEPRDGIRVGMELINVAQGTLITVPVTSLADFSDQPLHSAPNEFRPDFSDANSSDSNYEGGAISRFTDPFLGTVEDDWPEGIDAVSVVFHVAQSLGPYSFEPEISATPEWVISSPTFRFYAEQQQQNPWQIGYKTFDRHGVAQTILPCDIMTGPCHLPLTTLQSGLLGVSMDGTSRYGLEAVGLDADEVPDAGKITFNFHTYWLVNPDGNRYLGLPIQVFSTQIYVNGQLETGENRTSLANYGASGRMTRIRFIDSP